MGRVSTTTPWPVVLTNGSGLRHPIRATVETVIQGGRLPYHAIFSRGMMQRWIKDGWATTREELGPYAQWWDACAPLLEDAWNFWANRPEVRGADDKTSAVLIQERLQQAARRLFDYLVSCHAPPSHLKPHTSIPSPVSAGMIRVALDAGVRSFDQGLAAALDHLARDEGAALAEYCYLVEGHRPSLADIRQVEITNLKEGHTSSVVRVAVLCHGLKAPAVFGLNVARDLTAAADELEMNRRELAKWAALDPGGVAELYGDGEGHFMWFAREAYLPIVAVKWFEEFHELHVIRDPSNPNCGIFVLVNEFRQSSGPLPEMIGPRLDESTSDHLWAAIVAKRTRLAHIDWQSGTVEAPDLELNHGDVVGETQGEDIRVAFVASSARRWHGLVGDWPYEMALSSARDDRSPTSKRIYWGKPKQALRAVYEGILQRLPSDKETAQKLAIRMFEFALGRGADHIASALSPSPEDGDGWSLLRETRREMMTFLGDVNAGVPTKYN